MAPSTPKAATSVFIAGNQRHTIFGKTSEDVGVCLLNKSQPFPESDGLSLTGFERYVPSSGRMLPDVIFSPIQVIERIELTVNALVYYDQVITRAA